MKTTIWIAPKNSSVNISFESFGLQITNFQSILQGIVTLVFIFMLYFKPNSVKRN